MRKELIYPAPDTKMVQMARNFIDYIIKNPNDCFKEMATLNIMTGKNFSPNDFLEFKSYFNLRDLAELAVLPTAPKVNDLTKDEVTMLLNNIYKYIKNGDNLKATYYIELLETSFNKVGEISAYVFQPLNMGKVQPIVDYLFNSVV
ncbi:MAG: hypothetical protein LIO71_03855 [Ruminococcus sp.]|nr:hypothetical protein [Ruminococcus sp.]